MFQRLPMAAAGRHARGQDAVATVRAASPSTSCAGALAYAMPSDRSKAWANAGGKAKLEMREREIWATLCTVPMFESCTPR